MKALQIFQAGECRIVDLPRPSLHSGEVLLRLRYVGFCGSDLNTFRGANNMVTFPRIPGHEIGAVIEGWAPDVPDGLSVGQVVTVNPYTNCGKCASCRRGRVNACEHNETLGVQRDGAMAEYIAVPWQKVMPCPGISVRDAALIEPMSVGFHAVSRGRVQKDDVVMVVGCGMVGLGAVVAAVQRGADVIAADIDDDKLKIALALGAKYTYNTISGEGCDICPDVIIEAVGSVPTYRLALERVAFTGRVVCIGYAKTDVPLQTGLIVKKELDVMGTRNADPADFCAVMEYVRAHDVEQFISGIIEPEDAQKTLEEWSAAPGRVFRILTKWNTES